MENKISTKAVVMFSGGQDSTTCLFYAIQKFAEVYPIIFRYNQRHEIETKMAEKIINKYLIKKDFLNIKLDFLKGIAVSDLFGNIPINKDYLHPLKDNLPASYIPNRNLLFLTIAHTVAQAIKYDCII
jgi:7-cyano-7-deazaguanine synthase